MELRQLSNKDIDDIVKLTLQLNPDITEDKLGSMQREMFDFDNYFCFGFFKESQLLGISSGWILVKLYSGKQLEIDNVIVVPAHRSKGYGQLFLKEIDQWAVENGCKTVELNTYVQNSRSHKFYFNLNYKILGFHFQKFL